MFQKISKSDLLLLIPPSQPRSPVTILPVHQRRNGRRCQFPAKERANGRRCQVTPLHTPQYSFRYTLSWTRASTEPLRYQLGVVQLLARIRWVRSEKTKTNSPPPSWTSSHYSWKFCGRPLRYTKGKCVVSAQKFKLVLKVVELALSRAS